MEKTTNSNDSIEKIDIDSDNDSEDSSASEEEDFDEEIEQNKNFLLILSKIQDTKYDYNSYLELINIAKNLDLEKVRQSHELFSAAFPLSPNIWMDWLKLERGIANTAEELKKLIPLYRRALKDYYSEYSLTKLIWDEV